MPTKAEKDKDKLESTPPPKPRQKPPVVDDATVKETFADDFLGLYAVGPNFHFNFGIRRPVRSNAANATNAVNVASFISSRIVIPLEAAVELYLALDGVVSNLEKRGVVKRTPAAKNE